MPSVASLNTTLTAGCGCMLVAPLWCDLGCCSQTVVAFRAEVRRSFITTTVCSCCLNNTNEGRVAAFVANLFIDHSVRQLLVRNLPFSPSVNWLRQWRQTNESQRLA